MNNIFEVKDRVQQEALVSHNKAGGFSTLAMCTGAGKSRCGVLRAQEVVESNPNARILLGCFTEDQRDNVWKEEFATWGASDIYENNVVERVCYASLSKIIQQEFDLCIFDEFHHITENHILFFEANNIKSILGLTATPPEDKLKKEIIATVAPISFVYPVEQGIKDGVVAPYDIAVVYVDLEAKERTVEAGSKAKPFKQTELAAYTYWDQRYTEETTARQEFVKENLWPLGWSDNPQYKDPIRIETHKKTLEPLLKKEAMMSAKVMKSMSKRTRLIYNSHQKAKFIRRLKEEFCEPESRYLFFLGSIEQCNLLFPGRSFHSQTDATAFEKFKNEEYNVMAAVKAVNEGSNIKNLDYGIIGQLNSKELDVIQRIGRVIRIREGHRGKIIILVLKGTRDEEWFNKAIKNMKSFISIKKYTPETFFEDFRQQRLFI